MIERFVPSIPSGLYEYYFATGESRGLSRGQLQKGFNAWSWRNKRDLIRLAINGFDFDLIKLGFYSKAPIPNFNAKPLSYLQAMRYIRDEQHWDAGLWFGLRGSKRYINLDYDSITLTPELERLCSKTWTTFTPSGITFVVREPLVPELWHQMEEKFPGFAPSPATVKAREEMQLKDWESFGDVFCQEERDFFGKSKWIMGNARRNRSYCVLAGGITCAHQNAKIGLEKPKGLAHFGFGHTEFSEPCPGVEAGKSHWSIYDTEQDGIPMKLKRHDQAPLPCDVCKHSYFIRMLYKRDGNYFDSFTPNSVSVLSFETFAQIALGEKSPSAMVPVIG